TMDEDDKADDASQETPHKTSKRDRFKGALARTKSKFKKHGDKNDEDHILSDDVNDFLAAGRTSMSSLNNTAPSRGDALPYHPTPSNPHSPRPSTSDSASFTQPKQSPRRLNVPRIDVSNSQRYPGALPIGTSNSESTPTNDFLRPEYQSRSQSVSSLAKGKRRSRGLSVTFIEAPPVIIGIGGDDAPAPPVEISKARARARSVSPMRNRTQANDPVYSPNRSPHQPSNGGPGLPSHGPRQTPPDILKPRALQRIQTGLTPTTPVGRSDLDKEFEMSLQLWGGVHTPASSTASPLTPEIFAPTPIRPVHPPPAVMEMPEPHELKKEHSSGTLRKHFREEGSALRTH
ncbi:uncharacterized protein A1O9_06693, partial [Exophiala aquamarina CBS 119918]